MTPSTDPKRTKLIDTLLRQIGKLKPTDAPKKSLEDYFVLGTADLNVRTRDADVRLAARQGQQSVAEEALAQLRRQYDQSLAHQAQLRRIYAAATMRRT